MAINILLVEDDMINREVISRYLKDVYSVDAAENGDEAIKLTSEKNYDIILMDINLGKGLNGIEATAKIREIAGYKETPVIALTAYAMRGDREAFIEAGFVEYLPKPFLKEELIGLIKTLLPE